MKYDVVVEKLSYIPEKLMNCWVVEVTQMSGDADAFAHNSWRFTNELLMKEFVNFAMAVQDADNYAYGDCRKIKDILKDELDEEMYNRNISLLTDITGYDSTCDGQTLACVDAINVYWYNSLGVKYDCKVVEND